MRCCMHPRWRFRRWTVLGKEAPKMVGGFCWAQHGADVSIAYHALPFKYVSGSVLAPKRSSNSIELVDFYVAGEVSSTEGGEAAWCEVQHYCIISEENRHFSSSCWLGAGCSGTSGLEKHLGILSRLCCISGLAFWWVSPQDIWREHNESNKGDISEIGKLDFGDGHGQ